MESINIMDEHIVAATITALKKLEGLLILYGIYFFTSKFKSIYCKILGNLLKRYLHSA